MTVVTCLVSCKFKEMNFVIPMVSIFIYNS